MLNEIDAQIGARVKARRVILGISQREMAIKTREYLEEDAVLSHQQIQKYENGKNRISGSTLYAICKILEVSPNHILGWDDDDEGLDLHRKTLNHVRVYQRCSELHKYAIEQLTRILAE